MPKFRITSPEGKTLLIEGPSAPTQQEAERLFTDNSFDAKPVVVDPPKDPRNQTFEEFKVQERINAEKSFGEDALDFAGGVASGIGQIFSMGAGAIGETIGAVSDGEFKKILKSFPEGVAKSMFDLGEIGEAIGGRIGDQFVGDEESLMRQFQRQQQDFVDSDKRQAGLLFGADETLPQLSEIASIVGDPTNLIGLGVAGKLAKASKLGKTAQRAGEILDLPNKAIRAGLGKAVKGGALGAGTVLKALDKPLKGVSIVGEKVAKLAKRPRSVVQEITEKTLGIKSGNLGAVSKVGFMMGGPLGKILLGAELIGSKGANLYKNSVDAQKIANILANPDSRLSFLQSVATNPNISEGIRRLANLRGTQKGMDIAINAISNGVSAGVLQGIFTKLATDDLGQIGQAFGGGLAFGGLAPVGPKTIRSRGGESRPSSKGDLPVSLDPAQRARDLEALERERQANPENFNKEKANMNSFNGAFESKAGDARRGRGNEGILFPAGTKELYYARGEVEGVSKMNEIEGILQNDVVSNITYVKTGASSDGLSARKQIKSVIETITQDVVLLDIQLPGDGMTLSNTRGINVDVLRQIANERNMDMNFLLGELVTLKTHVRNGGKAGDPIMKENSIMQLLGEGEKSLMVQVEPRNIVNMKQKPLDTAINAPFVSPPIPEAPFNPNRPPSADVPEGELPSPKHLKKRVAFNKKQVAKQKKADKADAKKRKEFSDKPASDPDNIPDFKGVSLRDRSIPLGANGRITSNFAKAVDRSLHFFHGIRSRTRGNAMNRKSNSPPEATIKAEQQHLADTYGIEFNDVPAFAKRYNEAVKAEAKKKNKEGLDNFVPPNPLDFI